MSNGGTTTWPPAVTIVAVAASRRRNGDIDLQVRAFGLDHDLRVAVWQPQASGCRGAPDQRMSELIAVEREAGLQNRGREAVSNRSSETAAPASRVPLPVS